MFDKLKDAWDKLPTWGKIAVGVGSLGIIWWIISRPTAPLAGPAVAMPADGLQVTFPPGGLQGMQLAAGDPWAAAPTTYAPVPAVAGPQEVIVRMLREQFADPAVVVPVPAAVAPTPAAVAPTPAAVAPAPAAVAPTPAAVAPVRRIDLAGLPRRNGKIPVRQALEARGHVVRWDAVTRVITVTDPVTGRRGTIGPGAYVLHNGTAFINPAYIGTWLAS